MMGTEEEPGIIPLVRYTNRLVWEQTSVCGIALVSYKLYKIESCSSYLCSRITFWSLACNVIGVTQFFSALCIKHDKSASYSNKSNTQDIFSPYIYFTYDYPGGYSGLQVWGSFWVWISWFQDFLGGWENFGKYLFRVVCKNDYYM